MSASTGGSTEHASSWAGAEGPSPRAERGVSGDRIEYADASSPPPFSEHSSFLWALGSPELALGADRVLSPQLHAEDGGLGILLSRQMAAHHLVLVVLVSSLRVRGDGGLSRHRLGLLPGPVGGAPNGPQAPPSPADHACVAIPESALQRGAR